MTDANALDVLFDPQTVAVVGASTDPMRFGGLPVYYSLLRGFAGRICPVNARAPEVQGLQAFSSVREIDGPVDCAVVSVPAASVYEVLEDCAAKNVRAVVIFSSGYAEVSEEGRREQERIVALGREAGMRIVGPNCMGTFDLHSNFVSTFTTAFQHFDGEGWPKAGKVGIVSQSGAVGVHIMVGLRDRGIGVSKWLTMGNQSDVTVADGINHYAADPATEVIVAYMEGCPNGPALLAALDTAHDAGKPVLALKVGATEAGAAAAASHTASLAGADAVFDAAFRQHNVWRAETFPELVDVAAGCALGAYPTGPRVGVVSMSGGVGVLMADAAGRADIPMPPLSEGAQRKITDIVPFAGPRNPVDTAAPGMTDMSIVPDFCAVALEDGAVDSLAIFMSHLGHVERRQDEVRENYAVLKRKYPGTVMAMSMSAPDWLRDELEEAGYFFCEDPTAAIKALGALSGIAEGLKREGGTLGLPDLRDAPPPPDSGPLNEIEALAVLEGAGIPVVPQRLATSPDEAAAHAEALGFPVALKIASADIAHKSDIGGVLLGVADAEEARKGYGQLLDRARAAAPDASIDGVIVAPMIGDGVETILGVQRDPVFGPVVMFGIGGVFVEVYGDVVFRIAPFGVEEAHRMIAQVRGAAILDGVRGKPRADVDALADALARLSVYAHAHRDRIDTIDINPFIVRPAGEGAVAVDALCVVETTG